ncbi:MAG TPA: alpha/beta fold hydrolase [Puia sp.]|jgi:pimeloyl-ACP methyl ester carboxylesterase
MKIKQKLALRYIRARLNILSLVSPRKAAERAFRLFCTPQQRAPKKASPVFDKGEPLSFRLDDHTVRGHRWMPAAAPLKKVLIAHGFESSSRNFDIYINAFLKKGYEVLAFDAPAHGESGGRRITLPNYVKMLATIGQNYGPIQSFMGHSLGGLALALYLSGTPHNKNTRLVLIAPAVETTSAVDAFIQLLHLNPEVRKEMDEYVQEISGHPFSYYSLPKALKSIQAGILYLQDEEDRITPLKDALRVKEEGSPNIRWVLTKGLGHRKIYKDPEVMEKIVAFL